MASHLLAFLLLASCLTPFAWSLDQSDIQLDQLVSCYRHQIYQNGQTEYYVTPNESLNPPVKVTLSRDLLIQFAKVLKYASENRNADFKKEIDNCKYNSATQTEETIHFINAEKDHAYGNDHNCKTSLESVIEEVALSKSAEKIFRDVVQKRYVCQLSDVKAAAALVLHVGVGAEVLYCEGKGGQRWYSANIKPSVGAGVGAIAMSSRSILYEDYNGWTIFARYNNSKKTSGYLAAGIALNLQQPQNSPIESLLEGNVTEKINGGGVGIGYGSYREFRSPSITIPIRNDLSWVSKNLY